MSLAAVFLTPLVLLLPSAASLDVASELPEARVLAVAADDAVIEIPPEEQVDAVRDQPQPMRLEGWSTHFVVQQLQPDSAHQVRIERRMTIRVSPRQPQVHQNMFDSLPRRAIGPRVEERRIGKCLPVSGISGVQASGGKTILLYMQDRRVISASLERACRARDFYSGFYLSRSEDGRLCVDRDTLQSRSGANCKLTRIRQLVEIRE